MFSVDVKHIQNRCVVLKDYSHYNYLVQNSLAGAKINEGIIKLSNLVIGFVFDIWVSKFPRLILNLPHS